MKPVTRPLTGSQLASYRRFAEALEKIDDRRLLKRPGEIISAGEIIVSLLDEVERLKAAFVPRPTRTEGCACSPDARFPCGLPGCVQRLENKSVAADAGQTAGDPSNESRRSG